MKKVTLTKEQADAIDTAVGVYGKDDLMDLVEKPFVLLKELSNSKLARALYIGYEVEPEFKVGDWVKVYWSNKGPRIHEILEVNAGGVTIDGKQDNKKPPSSILEYATPEEIAKEKQRRWWKKHGREVWELKIGDELVNVFNKNDLGRIVESTFGGVILRGNKEKTPLNLLKEQYRVRCFVEDRKDL